MIYWLENRRASLTRLAPVPLLTYFLIGITGLIVCGTVSYGFFKGVRMNAVYSPLVDATMEIKLEGTSAYRWFEEMLESGHSDYMEAAWEHLHVADWYVTAMLEGGKNPEGTFIPVSDGEMRGKVMQMRAKLEDFKTTLRERLEEKQGSKAGSETEEKAQMIFGAFLKDADELETMLQELMAQDLRSFTSIQMILIGACLLLFISIGIGFQRFESRRTQHLVSLGAAKERLEGEIAERQRAEDILRSERDKLRGVLNAIDEEMFIVNPDYKIEYQNAILENLFPGAVGGSCCTVYMGSSEPCGFCRVHEAIDSGKIQHTETVLPSGRRYDMAFSPFTDADGKLKVIVFKRDVTEKETLRAEAIRAGHLAALGEMAAGVAHEINNPINGIINYAEILQDDGHQGEGDAEIPGRIIREGERIARIVKNLLAFARGGTDEPGFVSVDEVLSDSLGLLEGQLRKDAITVRVIVPQGLPGIRARHPEIQQVFLNLIGNARYALNKRFPEPNAQKLLEIISEPMQVEGCNYVRTTFQDTGIGIPASIMDKIGNPFFSTKPRGEGTGLGLSISHGIIKSHKGKIRFESMEGEYTKVMVDLPVCEESE